MNSSKVYNNSGNKLKNLLWFFILLILPFLSFAQKDVTQFLDIPVDGFKPEMIQKLKSKGYTINEYKKDILDGEFNGTDVNIVIGTNNNKVWRIAIVDVFPTDETNIKIRFNNLIQQFANHQRYVTEADSTIAKYSIPKDEDISYEIAVKKKRYQAVFYQKSIKYDSLTNEKNLLLAKSTLNDKEQERFTDLIVEILNESFVSFDKPVWFMIDEEYGKYRIMMYYDNYHNKPNGKDL